MYEWNQYNHVNLQKKAVVSAWEDSTISSTDSTVLAVHALDFLNAWPKNWHHLKKIAQVKIWQICTFLKLWAKDLLNFEGGGERGRHDHNGTCHF